MRPGVRYCIQCVTGVKISRGTLRRSAVIEVLTVTRLTVITRGVDHREQLEDVRGYKRCERFVCRVW